MEDRSTGGRKTGKLESDFFQGISHILCFFVSGAPVLHVNLLLITAIMTRNWYHLALACLIVTKVTTLRKHPLRLAAGVGKSRVRESV
jgi:hypothetical protein